MVVQHLCPPGAVTEVSVCEGKLMRVHQPLSLVWGGVCRQLRAEITASMAEQLPLSVSMEYYIWTIAGLEERGSVEAAGQRVRWLCHILEYLDVLGRDEDITIALAMAFGKFQVAVNGPSNQELLQMKPPAWHGNSCSLETLIHHNVVQNTDIVKIAGDVVVSKRASTTHWRLTGPESCGR